jgi:hypothetical protein
VSKSANPPLPTASAPVPSGTYHLSCPLEDKGVEKHLTDQILDVTLPVPIRDILAVSPDVRKNLHNISSNKHITVSTVSVNELSSHPGTNRWMCQYNNVCSRSKDSQIVTDHYTPLCCICTMTDSRQTHTHLCP